MKKVWIIEGKGCHYDTYEKAENAAKRTLAEYRNHEEWKIFELVARVVSPTPAFEVEKVIA